MSLKSKVSVAVRNPGYALRRAGGLLREKAADVVDGLSPQDSSAGCSIGREYMVIGLRRTGNHGVINWIENQVGGEGYHLNNLRLGENPYRYIRGILAGGGHGRDAWVAREMERYPQFQGAEGLSRLEAEARQEFAWKDYLIHSYEDVTVEKVAASLTPSRRDRYFGISETRYNLLILRDPFNLVASRLFVGYTEVNSWQHDLLAIWLEHAREYLGELTRLESARKVVVNFNRWATDRAYRSDLATRLGLQFTDAGIETVTSFGGGSSFDRRGFDGSAQKMKVNARWRHYENDPEFRAHFRDPAIFEYSARIFGEIEGTDVLRPR